MSLSQADIEHVASLARLKLAAEEIETFTQQINNILVYMEKLSELDTKDIQPTTHALHLSNSFREDQVFPSLPQEEALALAPEQGCSAFVVPKVI
ncbi:MAG: Asp-tRNA(Asn)/Glu-tRNA(Gln) amidotransferase subunit GatC [Thermodesulfobacteriota bacterium]